MVVQGQFVDNNAIMVMSMQTDSVDYNVRVFVLYFVFGQQLLGPVPRHVPRVGLAAGPRVVSSKSIVIHLLSGHCSEVTLAPPPRSCLLRGLSPAALCVASLSTGYFCVS